MKTVPDTHGYFNGFGGQYVPETLVYAIEQLVEGYDAFQKNEKHQAELREILKTYVGRPTPLFFAQNLTKKLGGAQIYLKREDLCHTGAHKINNAMAQAYLAVVMKKKRIIAETGAGQHGVASATAARYFGLPCCVYMGAEDIERQAPNVYKMKLLGAEVRPVHSGSKTLKDATNEAIRDWVGHPDDTFYLIGSTVGPHPYPMMVRDFQSVIGREVIMQLKDIGIKKPDYLVACIGGGSNSMGLFAPYLDTKVDIIGVEAAGEGVSTKQHAAALLKGSVGVLHGMKSYILQDSDGQVQLAHSISAGLDYPGVGPEHAYLKDSGRVKYVAITDKEALDGFRLLTETEGIIPALESSHALGYLKKWAPTIAKNKVLVMNLSGRGDKDLPIITKHIKLD